MRLFSDLMEFKATKAWGAKDLALVEGASVRLHWTDKPYKWHKNDGAEVFVVLDGKIDMHYRENGEEKIFHMKPNDIFTADIGDEHVAHPIGEARILVIEKQGSA